MVRLGREPETARRAVTDRRHLPGRLRSGIVLAQMHGAYLSRYTALW
jgi:hypothetical protein